MPATNILCAFIAGFLSTVLLDVARHCGYVVQPDIASGLPAALAVIVAHVYTVITEPKK